MKTRILAPWIREHVSLYFIIILFIWISFFPAPIQQSYCIYTYIFLGAMFFIAFEKKRVSIFKSDYFPLWIFLITIGMNVFSAREKDVAFQTYLDLAIPLFCIYYTLSEGVTAKQFDTLSKVICIVSIPVAFWGLLDFLLHTNWLYEYYIPNPYYQRITSGAAMRAFSTQFWSPPLGSYLIASFPFNLLLFQQNRPFFKIFGFIGMILCSTVIIMTLSRGVLLGFIAMVLFILYVNKKRHLLVIFLIIFCLFSLVCAYLYNPLNRLGFKQLLFLGRYASLSDYRFQRIFMAFQMVKDHLLTGVGFQHFRFLFNKYYTGERIFAYELKIADNMYLTLLAETGILGFSGFLVFIFSVMRKTWSKIATLSNQSLNKKQLTLILCAIIGILVNMAAYELFYWPNQYIFFCILLGCINSLLKNKNAQPV
ncbi:MAG: hypothetical protein AMJ95_01260 [Omnitrophica WOR_2 bacterium SM23_72]|nr:MAG: hypothetical protein AMJ95_01260 [Omnitrophica WOR_2 bacterium SM23_72]